MHCDILIQNCRVLQPDFTISEGQDVAISGGRICSLDTAGTKRHTAEQTLEGDGKLLMPGYTDGHTHCCQQLLRGRVADEYPMIWTRFLVPFESNLLPEDSYVSAKLACLEMIKNGTTSFADSGGVHMHRVADAVVESGMRAAIAKSTMDRGSAITGAMKETGAEAIARTEELYRSYQGAGEGRIQIFFGLRQVMTCSPELVRTIGEKAAEYKTGIHAHLCEHKDEVSFCLQHYKQRPVEFLEEMGVLGPNLLTAHNVMLSESDISTLARKEVKLIHCPRANLASHGFPKTPRILEAGISVGLGCDGAASGSLNLFDEMKVLRYASIAYWGLPSFNPVVMPCKALLNMVTQGGANAIGLGQELGSIQVGKLADVILINLRQPHLQPSQCLSNTLVESAGGHDVTDSIINGKLVMKNRVVLTLDEEAILAEAKTHMEQILRRAAEN